jgi:hypothetical protein
MKPFTQTKDMDNKPLVKVYDNAPFSKKQYTQGDINKAPVVKPTTSLSPLDILKNKVSDADSSKLQKATKVPGRVASNGGNFGARFGK